MDPQDRGVLVGANDEARGDDNAIVLHLRVDVLDAVDTLTISSSGPVDEFDRLVRLVTIALAGCDHRYADLRLFLARQTRTLPMRQRSNRQSKSSVSSKS